jgi:molybdopterin adenylyltransferase
MWNVVPSISENSDVCIYTSSDRGYAGVREDKSGPIIRKIAEENGYEVVQTILLPDEKNMLSAEMERIFDENIADIILTTGGTGFPPRDCMPEATMEIGQAYLKSCVHIVCS